MHSWIKDQRENEEVQTISSIGYNDKGLFPRLQRLSDHAAKDLRLPHTSSEAEQFPVPPAN